MWIVLAIRHNASVSIEARPLVGLAAATVASRRCVQALGPGSLARRRARWCSWRCSRATSIALLAFRVIPRRHFRPLARLARAALRSELGAKNPRRASRAWIRRSARLLASIERDGVRTAALAERARPHASARSPATTSRPARADRRPARDGGRRGAVSANRALPALSRARGPARPRRPRAAGAGRRLARADRAGRGRPAAARARRAGVDPVRQRRRRAPAATAGRPMPCRRGRGS